MLLGKMYVRCPADQEYPTDPRVFICGQITRVDEFGRTVKVRIYDPFSYLVFFENLPKGEIILPEWMVQRCVFFIDSIVIVNNCECKVLSYSKNKDGYFYYYLQNVKTKAVFRECETNIIVAFNNGHVDPAAQLKRYEFQNPSWFLGHAVVSKSMNILNNSIYGFKDLAGSKIYLLPHQVNSIMRCLQEDPCRYILADEVGMGKTIEAISVYKIYIKDKSNKRSLIIVPETLKEQWISELFLKFNIVQGEDNDNNSVAVKTLRELTNEDIVTKWDFVIIDEVHKYLNNSDQYDTLHVISKNTRNILLLSATPVQQRQEEYLSLLRILQPEKYDAYTVERFGSLVAKQDDIVQKTALILDDLDDYEDEVDHLNQENDNPHDSEDVQELFEEIQDGLEEICNKLDDIKLTLLFDKIAFDEKDCGIYAIKVIISYICSNYQIESHIIRNRRKLLEVSDDGERLLPIRKLETVSYKLDNEKNTYETLVYDRLCGWIDSSDEIKESPESVIKPLLGAFFSSPWAFSSELKKIKTGLSADEIFTKNVFLWKSFEDNIINNIVDIIDDPDHYADEYSTRIVSVLNEVYENLYDQKIVLFTNYSETFNAYKVALSKLFPEEEVSFFGDGFSEDELELNAYRFQNDPSCRIMLCDRTGGEGRNFQIADYIVHIDLPWDANMIEQRIGRLDRLERDPARPVVYSVVIYSEDTFEEALFKFWNNGLKIFTQSLSGMEIIMGDINKEIISAVQQNFKYGLLEKIPTIVELADRMRTTVRKEQNFDAAGFIFRPMYNELKRLINYYTENENELFATTMTQWASLAGFHGSYSKEGVITYSPKSFVPKSAVNALLIPPKWNDYISSAQNAFINHVQEEYDRQKAEKTTERSIKGTFIRKIAIENDYLHFFAPGDAVFDCIVDNAMHSCKGQASAFIYPTDINWTGFFFTWALRPNIDYLLSNGASIYALSPYRNFLMSEQVVIPISINNDDEISDDVVLHEFNKLIEAGFREHHVIHIGKRSRTSGNSKSIIQGKSNIEWFRQQFSEEDWQKIVEDSRKEASQRALEIFKHRSNIRSAKEEMERTLSARAANAEYYGLTDEGIEKLKRSQDAVLNAIKKPRMVLDSAAFVWMVKRDNA